MPARARQVLFLTVIFGIAISACRARREESAARPSASGPIPRVTASAARCTSERPSDCEAECKAEDQKACVMFGRQLLSGHGITADPARARALLETACAKGIAEGCGALGSMHMGGIGVPRDTKRGLELFKDACKRGDALSCESLGGTYAGMDPEISKSIPPDPTEAVAWYEKACALDAVKACVVLAGHLADGHGASKDLPRANMLLGKACERNDRLACKLLADHLSAGEGIEKNERRAGELYRKSCSLGYQRACSAQ